MKLKEHIEKFDESMEESLGESPKPFAVDGVVSVMVITVAVVGEPSKLIPLGKLKR
tara:strand:- start:12 stop:179 length:168 start_codon:yes stop_codon:yes gene_type:complete